MSSYTHNEIKQSMELTKLEFICLIIGLVMTIATISVAVFFGWLLATKSEVRKHVLESVQDGDNVTHQSDGRYVVSLLLGIFSAWLTGCIMLVCLAENLVDPGHIFVITLFVGITFTLLGIAWKKP